MNKHEGLTHASPCLGYASTDMGNKAGTPWGFFW